MKLQIRIDLLGDDDGDDRLLQEAGSTQRERWLDIGQLRPGGPPLYPHVAKENLTVALEARQPVTLDLVPVPEPVRRKWWRR